MSDYSDAASKYIENMYNHGMESANSDADKEAMKNYKEHLSKVSKSVLKVMSENGPDLFNNINQAEEKILQQCIQDGVYKKDGEFITATTTNGGLYFERDKSLALIGMAIAQSKALEICSSLENNKLNTKYNTIAREFKSDFYSCNGGHQQAKLAMEFVQSHENSYQPNKFTKENIDLNAKASNETKDKSMLNENEFKTMLAERVRDMDKIKQYENDPNQRYYGNGLMAIKDQKTEEITRYIGEKQVDKKTFMSLHQMHINAAQKDDGLLKGVKKGSLIILYDPYSKKDGMYNNVKFLTQQQDGNIVEIDKENANKISIQDQASGKKISEEKLYIENYGGGLIMLQDTGDNKLFLNTKNIANPKTNKSRNMIQSNIMNNFKNAER